MFIFSHNHALDVSQIVPSVRRIADMLPDNVGEWMLHCHVTDHMHSG